MNEVRVKPQGGRPGRERSPVIFTSDIVDRDGAQPGQPVKSPGPAAIRLHRTLQFHFVDHPAHALAADRRDRPRFSPHAPLKPTGA
jgi:hypothetical protein